MMDKIKLIAIGAAALLLALTVWYVQGLRADNERLTAELAQAQAVVEQQSNNLGQLKAATQISAAAQSHATQTIFAMNKELSAARQAATARRTSFTRQGVTTNENNNPTLVLVASQLDRLFHSTADSGTANPARFTSLPGPARYNLGGTRPAGGLNH